MLQCAQQRCRLLSFCSILTRLPFSLLSRVHLVELLGAHLVEILITVLIGTRHWTASWQWSSPHCHAILRSILISSHLCLGSPGCPFPSGLLTTVLTHLSQCYGCSVRRARSELVVWATRWRCARASLRYTHWNWPHHYNLYLRQIHVITLASSAHFPTAATLS
jgi:hypothetical protein